MTLTKDKQKVEKYARLNLLPEMISKIQKLTGEKSQTLNAQRKTLAEAEAKLQDAKAAVKEARENVEATQKDLSAYGGWLKTEEITAELKLIESNDLKMKTYTTQNQKLNGLEILADQDVEVQYQGEWVTGLKEDPNLFNADDDDLPEGGDITMGDEEE